MAKNSAPPPAPETKSTWSIEDLPLIQEQIETLQDVLNKVHNALLNYDERVATLEKKLVNIDLGDKTLPSEVVAGLSPGDIYKAALTAAISATITGNPGFMQQAAKYQTSLANNCIEFALLVLQQQLARHPGK